MTVEGSEQILPIRITIGVGVGDLGACAAIVLDFPGSQVAGIVIVILVAVVCGTICLLVRSIAKLAQTVISVVPIGLVYLVCNFGDVANIIIGVLEP